METINVSNYTIKRIILSHWIENPSRDKKESLPPAPSRPKIDIFRPIRSWIEGIAIDTPELARRICKLIPAQCPFARKISLFGRTILTIPPLCKINPVYEELMVLRFRALTYLADECGEDVSAYC
ncbi:Mo-dependent nitrogenase C-terminal domain-containing protein [Pannus brasiliensis CCIBt3594]|uniref:Mo-dependent nitrogenase C-terminal domain-containing protein n=1 Tax=Pannus brasiliensis CCIBt3594 TaxID=1427578 RepID=A0AAW9R258_9CHRO